MYTLQNRPVEIVEVHFEPEGSRIEVDIAYFTDLQEELNHEELWELSVKYDLELFMRFITKH